MEIIQKVRETIDRYSMLSENGRVLIGLSGGPDSICLSIILDRLREEFNLSLSAVYINHGLRPGETDDEISFCRKFCSSYRIEFLEKSVSVKDYAKDKGRNLQEAARELRYQVFEEVSEQIGAESIALGHNADDQAETILMRLFRGSGRRGLSGIPPVRNMEFRVKSSELRMNRNILIIRPLIEIERREIEDFLSRNSKLITPDSSVPYIIDTSNLKEDYFRNWIRLSLLNEVKKKNPSVVSDICRTADIFREEDEYLELKVTKTLMRLISRKSDTSIELFLAPLGTLEKPVLRRVLRRALDVTRGLRGISYQNIEDMISLIKSSGSGHSINLPGGIRAVKDYSLLKISSDIPVRIGEYELHPQGETEITETGDVLTSSLEDSGEESIGSRNSVVLDAGDMIFPLRIRHRRDGDFFFPLGFGKKKKLQDFFVDEKISRDERDRVPLVMSGNDIIWVAGYRADDRFKVTGKTEKYLRLTLHRLNKI